MPIRSVRRRHHFGVLGLLTKRSAFYLISLTHCRCLASSCLWKPQRVCGALVHESAAISTTCKPNLEATGGSLVLLL